MLLTFLRAGYVARRSQHAQQHVPGRP